MNVVSYARETTHDVAIATVAEPDPRSPMVERTLVAADGYWQPGDWRQDVQAVVTAGHPLGALGVRSSSAERGLASRDWADIARRLVSTIGWRDSPWVAVRTSRQSMVVLGANAHRPDPSMLQRCARAASRRYSLTNQSDHLSGPRAQPRPMRILDAHHTSEGQLAVLVDRIPDTAELRFTRHLVDDVLPTPRHPAPRPLYIGTHPDGYVLELFDGGDGRGFSGEPFDLALVNGSICTVVGPHSSGGAARVARHLPDVYLGRISLHGDPRTFRESPTRGVPSVLTNSAAQRALLLAARQITKTRPAALARSSYPPQQVARVKPTAPEYQEQAHVPRTRRAGR